MRTVAVGGTWLIALVVLQCALVPKVPFLQAIPDLFLLSVVYVAMRSEGAGILAWSFAVGLFQDVLSGGIVGLNVLSKPLTGMLAVLFRDKLDFHNPNTQAMVAFLATLSDGLLLSVLLGAHQPAQKTWWTLSHYVLPAAALNGIVFPLTLAGERLGRRWWSRLGRRLHGAAN